MNAQIITLREATLSPLKTINQSLARAALLVTEDERKIRELDRRIDQARKATIEPVGKIVEALHQQEKEASKAYKQQARQALIFAVIVTLIGVFLAMAMAWTITRRITKPVSNVANRLKDIAEGEGDLTMRLEIPGPGRDWRGIHVVQCFRGKATRRDQPGRRKYQPAQSCLDRTGLRFRSNGFRRGVDVLPLRQCGPKRRQRAGQHGRYRRFHRGVERHHQHHGLGHRPDDRLRG